MNSMIWWLVFLIASILLELSSPGYFFFLAFSIGAASALLCAWLDIGTALEFCVFLLVSGVSFYFLKTSLKTIAKEGHHKTNVYALQGKKALVVESITEKEKGWVKIDGELWAAVSVSDVPIEKNSFVEVVSTAGSHVRVKKIV